MWTDIKYLGTFTQHKSCLMVPCKLINFLTISSSGNNRWKNQIINKDLTISAITANNKWGWNNNSGKHYRILEPLVDPTGEDLFK